MILPFVGAFLEATGVIIEKRMLKLRGLNFKNYTVFSFLAIVLVSIPFLFFTWRLDSGAFEEGHLLILGAVILCSILANLLVYYALKREDVTQLEPIWLMQPLFTVLFAVLFYPAERNGFLFFLAMIAGFVLIISHLKRSHLYFNRYLVAGTLGSLFFAIELVLSKSILEFYSPFTFYFIRCLGIFIITLLLFRPSVKVLNGKLSLWFLLIGLLWVLYRAIIYYAYGNIGIVLTTMVFILSPVLMYIFAVLFLKEKPSLKQTISMIIILICVALAFINN
ncbi:MAG: DMT family transporter [Nanoarchaeota archaeon]